MFLPIGDDNRGRQRFPWVTMGLIALNVLVFVAELAAHGRGDLEAFVTRWAAIPADYTRGAGLGGPVPWTLVSSMFLHGGWAHVVGNLLYLGIFGDNVESEFGHLPYLGFYLLSGVIASAAHIATSAASTVPTLGASGAIAGVLAAYLLMFPRNSVLVIIWFRVRPLPAALVIGLWAVFQFVIGAGSLLAPREGGGVAYLAHIGGFLAGLALTPLLRRPPRPEANA